VVRWKLAYRTTTRHEQSYQSKDCVSSLVRNQYLGKTLPLFSLFHLFPIMICRHLENNKLTGSLPSYLGSLPSLQALYVSIIHQYLSSLLLEQLVAFFVVSLKFLQLFPLGSLWMHLSMSGTYRITHLPGIYQQDYYLQKSLSSK
jgi:hypothetical protein